ncbi:hypothetical protein [Helicobacter gastrofelis]
MKPLHIHERSGYIVLYEPIERKLFDEYERMNEYIEELERKGKEDLKRQGYDTTHVQHRLEMDMRYGNQRVTTSVVLDINRFNHVGDVLRAIRTFSDVYAKRYGKGVEAPEAGVRVQTVRVATFIDTDVVHFKELYTNHKRTIPPAKSHRKVHFVDENEPIETPIYDESVLSADYVIHGPAIVTTKSTTYLVEKNWRIEPTPQGAVWLLKENVKAK